MMYNRNELTLAMFYASSTNDEGNKVATITVKVNNSDQVSMQTSKLVCVTGKGNKKTYQVGEQSVSNGSDPLLTAIENYWRQDTESIVNALLMDVSDFITGNINTNATFLGFDGLKIFEMQPLESCIPDSVLQADGGTAPELEE
ncbi:hypothetical protein L9335_004886 [Klebsiella aerogenes]|uniref:hypothetical protein n=1 Tax=Klebsiella aerogenes TaxID=548 RepID=UPI00187307FF|nr:hypothetical protein [Klebsiella aerogenes]EIV6853061.1 hypothetical protein [Klebsiella aerogenes]